MQILDRQMFGALSLLPANAVYNYESPDERAVNPQENFKTIFFAALHKVIQNKQKKEINFFFSSVLCLISWMITTQIF